VETPEEVADTIGRHCSSCPKAPADRLHQLRPGADDRAVAEAKLQALAQGAALARQRLAAGQAAG
jgi:5-methyltetrahydropteroyltriglutamate--homocysteine methyltransferase